MVVFVIYWMNSCPYVWITEPNYWSPLQGSPDTLYIIRGTYSMYYVVRSPLNCPRGVSRTRSFPWDRLKGFFKFLFFSFFFFYSYSHTNNMEVPKPGIYSESQLQPTAAVAILDPVNPLHWVRDQTHASAATQGAVLRFLTHYANGRNSWFFYIFHDAFHCPELVKLIVVTFRDSGVDLFCCKFRLTST